jgi:hypothetical protein
LNALARKRVYEAQTRGNAAGQSKTPRCVVFVDEARCVVSGQTSARAPLWASSSGGVGHAPPRFFRTYADLDIDTHFTCILIIWFFSLPDEKKNVLKVLHSYLDECNVAFVCISNQSLDAANANRMVQVHRCSLIQYATTPVCRRNTLPTSPQCSIQHEVSPHLMYAT